MLCLLKERFTPAEPVFELAILYELRITRPFGFYQGPAVETIEANTVGPISPSRRTPIELRLILGRPRAHLLVDLDPLSWPLPFAAGCWLLASSARWRC